jgi:hypothetical protein
MPTPQLSDAWRNFNAYTERITPEGLQPDTEAHADVDGVPYAFLRAFEIVTERLWGVAGVLLTVEQPLERAVRHL